MSSIYDWSLVASDNQTADGDIDWREGQLPSTVNNSARMMMTRFAEWLKDQGVLSAGGTANALTVTATSPFNTLETGIQMRIKVAATNTGAATLNANGLGSKKLRKKVRGTTADQDLAAGDLQQSHIYPLVYDGAADSGAGGWIVLDPEVTDFSLAPAIHSAAAKTTPVDADELPISDSAASWGLKKLTWSNIKAAIRTFLTGTSNTWTATQRFNGQILVNAIAGDTAARVYIRDENDINQGVLYWDRVGDDMRLGVYNGTGSALLNFFILDENGLALATGALSAPVLSGQLNANNLVGTIADERLSPNVWRTGNQPAPNTLLSGLAGANGSALLVSGDPNPYTLGFRAATTTATVFSFWNTAANQNLGSVIVNNPQNSTTYNTTSDYRLKEEVMELKGSGEFIDALRPVNFTWTNTGYRTAGFLAHEFQEVAPGSVTGEKDAVDAEGNPIYQSMDAGTPEVVANIVAEIQSLRRRVEALEFS